MEQRRVSRPLQEGRSKGEKASSLEGSAAARRRGAEANQHRMGQKKKKTKLIHYCTHMYWPVSEDAGQGKRTGEKWKELLETKGESSETEYIHTQKKEE